LHVLFESSSETYIYEREKSRRLVLSKRIDSRRNKTNNKESDKIIVYLSLKKNIGNKINKCKIKKSYMLSELKN